MKKILDEKQLTALRIIKGIGNYLIRRGMGELIADDYRNGATTRKIAEDYIPERYRKSEEVEQNIIRYVLEKVLEPEERERIGREHQEKYRTIALSIAHQKLKNEKIAMYHPDPTVRSEIARKAVLSKGQIPWSEEERKDLAN